MKIPSIHLKRWFEWSVSLSIFTFFCMFLFNLACMVLFSEANRYDGYEKSFHTQFSKFTSSSSDFNSQYLTHRLVKMDLSYGITSPDNFRLALQNINRYLQNVNKTCPLQNTDTGKIEFITCANKVLHDNFYYTPSEEVSNNYAIHRSDCDTNTYLMMDALRLKGIQGYIVYAPGHAFLAWKDSIGNFRYHETTDQNNLGKPADLRSDFYTKTFEKSYYTPFDERVAETVYNALIYDKSKGRVNIDELYKSNQSNAFISDWYFYSKNKNNDISESDVKTILSLLQTDFTSTDKRLAVISYLINNNQKEQALVMLKNIPADKCSKDCFEYNVKLGRIFFVITKKVFFMYDNHLNRHSLSANLHNFIAAILIASIAALISIICLIYLIRTFPSRIKRSLSPYEKATTLIKNVRVIGSTKPSEITDIKYIVGYIKAIKENGLINNKQFNMLKKSLTPLIIRNIS